MAELAETLRSVPLFAGMSERDLERLASRMKERRLAQGHTLTTEGERGIGFFLITEGRAKVSVGGDEVGSLGPGDHFGEIALIDGGRRSATVVAETDMECYGMSAWEFRPLVQQNPDMAWALVQALVQRLRNAEQRRRG
jgi:CRP-like cAMP-binding protein